MSDYDDNNTGIIGQNDYKQAGTKQPEQKGRAKIGGLWYWLSGWDKNASNGRAYTSLSFTLMTQDEADKQEEKQRAKRAPQQQPQGQQQQAAPRQQSTPQQQTPPANHPAAPGNEPPVDFDDDIPF